MPGGHGLTGSKRRRRAPWAVWLAVLALGLNALVPIHLALDLGEALGAAHPGARGADGHGLEWRLLAFATGHDAGDGRPDGDRHPPTCPVFGALGALGGCAVVAAPVLPAPALVEASPALPALAEKPDPAPAAAYRSRAPPLA
jgi:hypothetical protein